MTATRVAVRLGMDGKAEFQADFADATKNAQGSLNALGDASDKVATRAEQAAARQEAAWRRAADAAKQAAIAADHQAQFNRVLGVNAPSAGSAAASASVFAEQARQMEMLEAKTRAVKAALDPLGVAQEHYAGETKVLNELLATGRLTQVEHTAAMAMARKEMDAAEKAAKAMAGGVSLNHNQMQIMAGVAHHTADALAAGINPMRVLVMEGVKAAPAFGGLGAMASGAASALGVVGFAAIGTAGAFVAGAASAVMYDNAFSKLKLSADGAGRVMGVTAQQMETAAEKGAEAARITEGAARKLAVVYTDTGKIGGAVLGGLIGVTKEYADVTGVKVDEAGKKLAILFSDPVKGAHELADSIGALDAKTARYIERLVEEGKRTQAQSVLLQALKKDLDGAADHVSGLAKAWDGVKTAALGAWDAMGHAISRAMGGGTTAEKLAAKISERASTADMASHGSATAQRRLVEVDRELADLRAQLKAEQVKNAAGGANAASVRAMTVANASLGTDHLDELKRNLADLRRGAQAGADHFAPDDWKRLQEAIDGTTRAVNTFLPPAEKARKIAELDAKAAGAKTPALKAQIAAEKERVELSGRVMTQADAEAAANAKGTQAKEKAAGAGAKHAATLAREAESMEVAAKQSLLVAAAYLQSDAAGQLAEARRKALTDATKKGIDADAQARRQIALQQAEAAANGAKEVSTLRDEATARGEVTARYVAGELSAKEMNKALADEKQLRPFVAAASKADGVTKAMLLKVVADLRDAQARLNDETEKGALITAHDNITDRIAQLRLETAMVDDLTGARERALAVLKAQQGASPTLSYGDRLAVRKDAFDEAGAANDNRKAQLIAQQARSMQDQADLTRVEIALVGKSAVEHDVIIARLREEQTLRAAGVDLTSKEAQALVNAAGKQALLNEALRKHQASWDELKSTGDRVLDDLFNPDNWNNWGDLGRKIIKDLEAEFIKLALLNPLKNQLFHEGLPTLGGFNIGSLFGGGGGDAIGSGVASMFSGFAGGTNYAPGGMAWIAENGPELVELPQGAKVHNAVDTRRLLSGPGGGSATHVAITMHNDMRGMSANDMDAFELRLQQLQAELPGVIINTVADARERRVLGA